MSAIKFMYEVDFKDYKLPVISGIHCFIRIFIGCELQIEISATRVTVQHHEACRTVIPSDGIFSSHQTAIMDSFSCILILRQKHLSLHTG